MFVLLRREARTGPQPVCWLGQCGLRPFSTAIFESVSYFLFYDLCLSFPPRSGSEHFPEITRVMGALLREVGERKRENPVTKSHHTLPISKDSLKKYRVMQLSGTKTCLRSWPPVPTHTHAHTQRLPQVKLNKPASVLVFTLNKETGKGGQSALCPGRRRAQPQGSHPANQQYSLCPWKRLRLSHEC